MFAHKLIGSVALAAFLTSIFPVVALADEGRPGDRSEERGRGREKGKDAQFPMLAEKFKEMSEKRLAKARARIEKRLDRREATPEQRAEAMQRLDAGSAKIRAVVDAATKDGTVTKEEAKQVREVARELKERAKGHHKGKGKGKGKRANDKDA